METEKKIDKRKRAKSQDGSSQCSARHRVHRHVRSFTLAKLLNKSDHHKIITNLLIR